MRTIIGLGCTALQLGNAKKGDKETIGAHGIAWNKTAQPEAVAL